MAQAPYPTRPDIGPYRKLRLGARPNKQGYWEIYWSDARFDYATRHHSTNLKDLVEAQDYFNAFCRDRQAEVLAAAPAGPKRPPTIEQLCRSWLDAIEPRKVANGRQVLADIRRELGHLTADQLDDKTLKGYGVRFAQGTVRRRLGALRTVLVWARDSKPRLISADDVPVFKKIIPEDGPSRDVFLDAVREAWFWAEAQRWGDPGRWTNPHYAQAAYKVGLFVAIGLDTAARKTAILELTWDRVNFGTGLIDFRVPGQPENPYKKRTRVPIARRLMPILKEAWLKAPKDAAGRATGPVIDVVDIKKPFKTFTVAIGAPEITPHILRHTWGSLRAMEGVPLWDIAKGMGDTIETIEKYYLHLTPGHLKTAFKA